MTPVTRIPVFASCLALLAGGSASGQFYTDTGSPSNPPWSAIRPTLNNGSNSNGPVNGSVINVNNTNTEVGLYGNRPISVGGIRIHVPCHTSTTNFGNFTRWFQTDGNTHVFRLFVNDENTATNREGANVRSEAFTPGGWNYADNVTYEWTARYTIARRRQHYAIFQLFNSDNEWALQLGMTTSGGLLVDNRRNAPDVILRNPDGSVKNFDGKAFDVRVIDDGHNYKCWIDGELVANRFYSRPTGNNSFRWGMYLGASILTPPSDVSVILVSGAQVRSWPRRLDSSVTNIVKANNTQPLGSTASWNGTALPGIHNLAVWNSTLTAANTTTLDTAQTWGGIRITSPGGNVTINGTAVLKLENEGLDMSTSSRNLTVNCPVEPNVTAPWVIAANRTATFNGRIRGYQGISLGGSGRLILTAANTYTGPTVIGGGTLQLGDGGTTGSLDTSSEISVAAGATFAVNRSNNVTQGTHFSDAPITGAGGLSKAGAGTLTLRATHTYTGPTTVSEGTLQLGGGASLGAISPSSAISVANGATFAVNRSGIVTQGTDFSGAAITGAGGLKKAGVGTLILTAANSFTGPVTVERGTLQLGNGGASGRLSPSASITLAGGATFAVNRSNTVTQGTDFSAAAITGAGGLSKSGAGSLILTAANSYTGATTINAGILQIGEGGASGTLGNNGAVSIASGAELRIERDVTSTGYYYGGTLSGTGTVNIPTGRRMNFLTNNQTSSGSLAFDVNGILGVTTNSGVTEVRLGSLSGSGTVQRAGGAGGAATVTIGGKGGNSIFAGRIISSELGVTKAGGGALVLTGSSAYEGATRVSAGTLQLGDGGTTGALGTASAIHIATGATFAVNRSNNVIQGTHFSAEPITGGGHLVKSGAGTLTLTAANAYSGNTKVNQGVLSIRSPNLHNDASTVTIAETGAALDLDFSGTDTVKTLVIGTEAMPIGTYKALGSPAAGTGIPQITGTGTLTVTSGSAPILTGFEAWKAANEAEGGFDEDDDGDGVPNGVEFFLGGESDTRGHTTLPGVEVLEGALTITWTKGPGYTGAYGSGYVVETSETLTGTWVAETEAPAVGATVTFPTDDTVRYTFPNPPTGRKFVRLRVNEP